MYMDAPRSARQWCLSKVASTAPRSRVKGAARHLRCAGGRKPKHTARRTSRLRDGGGEFNRRPT